jgi:hypothetical protein
MKNITDDVTLLVKNIDGMSYIPWADALSKTNPIQHVVLHQQGGVVHPIFGGGVVAIEQPVSKDGALQRTTLVVLDAKSRPIPYQDISSRDVGDAINRCRARSAAVIDGLGLGLYMNVSDGAAFLKRLGVNGGTRDLTQVPAWTDKKGKKENNGQQSRTGAEYLPWSVAIAAARLTDPEFVWSVVDFDTPDENGVVSKQPYIRVPYGYMVAVDLNWKGRAHREFLPIMGVQPVQTRNGIKPMDHQPLPNPTAADWHKAVMRALAKGIAMLTGYGRSAYADEVGSVPGTTEQEEDPRLQEIRALVIQTQADEAKMLSTYRVPNIESASSETLDAMLAALHRKKSGVSAITPGNQPPVEEPQNEAAPAENAALYERIETLVRQKGISDATLRSFFKSGNPRTASPHELQRALQALERAKGSAAAQG